MYQKVSPTPNKELTLALQVLYEDTRKWLNAEAKIKVYQLCKYQDVFSLSSEDYGRTNIVQHKVNTGDSAPTKQCQRKIPLAKQKEVGRMITDVEN